MQEEKSMKWFKAIPAFCATLLVTTALAGCAESATKESTGGYIDDTVVTTKVKTALFNDKDIKSSEISVQTFKGRVQLSGFVSSAESAKRAVEVTRRVQGVLVTWATWHWIFLINIPIGIAGLLYARKHMPNFTTARRRFDITGFLLFGLSLVLFSSGIELFGERIVASWIALTVIVTSIGLLLLYILHARHTPNPLILLDLFKTRTFSIGIVGNIATRLGTGCVPFLTPLMLQVGFGYQAFIAGCMMAPTALGSIIAKSMVTQVLRRLGYRHTLVGITVIIGLMIAQFSLQSPAMAIWMLILPLFILGMAMSTQFTAMNTITLADLTDDNASSGNSVLAVTQQLSISLGVAVSAAVLRVYEGMEGTTTVEQFHYTFITMGIITVASAAMFMLLKTTDGNNLIKRQRKSKPNRVPSESE